MFVGVNKLLSAKSYQYPISSDPQDSIVSYPPWLRNSKQFYFQHNILTSYFSDIRKRANQMSVNISVVNILWGRKNGAICWPLSAIIPLKSNALPGPFEGMTWVFHYKALGKRLLYSSYYLMNEVSSKES